MTAKAVVPKPGSPRLVLSLVFIVAAVFGAGSLLGSTGRPPEQETRSRIGSPGRGAGAAIQFVDLTDRQLGALGIAPAALRSFETLKTAVGTIDFNQNMTVQVFSQYPGKIARAFCNLGDTVRKGDILFTVDSPDLLQAESTLLASGGMLQLQTRTLARASQLLKAGGSAQKDVDQATSDQQTAEGNFKAAKDAVRIFGKTDSEIEQILAQRKVDSTLFVTSPIAGTVIARNAAEGFLTQPGAAPPPYSVADLSTMWMIANVIETDAPSYRVGQDRAGSRPGLSRQGVRWTRYHRGLDDRSRTPIVSWSVPKSPIRSICCAPECSQAF